MAIVTIAKNHVVVLWGIFFTPFHNGPFRARPSSLSRPHDYTQTHHNP